MRQITTLNMIKTGQKIAKAIKDNNYTVREVQEALKLSCPQPVYRWIHGETLPSIDNLYILSKLFNMHMEDLVESDILEIPVKKVSLEKKKKRINCVFDE